jgi:hypothetical protein
MTSASGPAGMQNAQLGGTAVRMKRFCFSPTSNGIMNPCNLTSVLSSFMMLSLNCGTNRSLSLTDSTCASVLHGTTPFMSGSILPE